MFADDMYSQPNASASRQGSLSSMSIRPIVAAAFVGWALSLARLLIAFLRAELSLDTILALAFAGLIPWFVLSFWARERRVRRTEPQGNRAPSALSSKDARAPHLRLVHTTSEPGGSKRRPDPNGTRAA